MKELLIRKEKRGQSGIRCWYFVFWVSRTRWLGFGVSSPSSAISHPASSSSSSGGILEEIPSLLHQCRQKHYFKYGVNNSDAHFCVWFSWDGQTRTAWVNNIWQLWDTGLSCIANSVSVPVLCVVHLSYAHITILDTGIYYLLVNQLLKYCSFQSVL